MQRRCFMLGSLVGGLSAVPAFAVEASKKIASGTCSKAVYLTFDTGHMGIAQLVAQVLQKHKVPVTFFAANEATKEGGSSLGDFWAPWWKARADEGHQLASHTFDHMYWLADIRDKATGQVTHFKVKPSAGPRAGQSYVVSADEYRQEIARSAQRLAQITGRKTLPLYRAPGGKTSPALIAAAQQGGFQHVGWAPAGFLGDELPSDRYPNERLLAQALKNIGGGDILLAHLGIWSRQDPWAPAVLEPLIVGLLDKGFCFRTLAEHPAYQGWIAQHR
ncbi:polysaccharide deacetylase family protein [Comamonas thiooxydans]|uniref:polysaccharide deacetylase family protein n=1 Tax=Comamonas thiooxydans TaxID=363952 RepID=UPI000A2D61D4|nr:polysaccharide deacetylase family protein [Comamonas thiooxydans]BDR10377.1 polysaccharide deacetylase family protein [Comamonas thiooxydans]